MNRSPNPYSATEVYCQQFETAITLSAEIAKKLSTLSPEQQREAPHFIAFLQYNLEKVKRQKEHSLKAPRASEVWKDLDIDTLEFQQHLRAE